LQVQVISKTSVSIEIANCHGNLLIVVLSDPCKEQDINKTKNKQTCHNKQRDASRNPHDVCPALALQLKGDEYKIMQNKQERRALVLEWSVSVDCKN
jgi:hypothetical protein